MVKPLPSLNIDFGNIGPSRVQLHQRVTAIMHAKVKKIRSGSVITQAYAPSTKMRRRQAGLQTTKIDLTGNDKYSGGKNWRLLDNWKVKVASGKNGAVTVQWKKPRAAAARQYAHIVRQFGQVIRRA